MKKSDFNIKTIQFNRFRLSFINQKLTFCTLSGTATGLNILPEQ